jgi:hypothetical protein
MRCTCFIALRHLKPKQFNISTRETMAGVESRR